MGRDVRVWVKCVVPPPMQDRDKALASALHHAPTMLSYFLLSYFSDSVLP